jgi:hypothetical protein
MCAHTGMYLTHLTLRECEVDDACVCSIGAYCHSLDTLILIKSHPSKLTSSSIICIAHNCLKLRHLNLSSNANICDDAIYALISHSHHLAILDLLFCEKLTYTSIHALLEARGDKLLLVDITHIPALNNITIQQLKKYNTIIRSFFSK